jgi:hypothetical protein
LFGPVTATDRQKKAFLEVYARTMDAAKARRAADLSVHAYVQAIESDPDFARDVDLALKDCLDAVEGVFFKACVKGRVKRITHKGQVIATERVHEIAPGLALLRGRRREVFTDPRGAEEAAPKKSAAEMAAALEEYGKMEADDLLDAYQKNLRPGGNN